jgi:hypothetical protein
MSNLKYVKTPWYAEYAIRRGGLPKAIVIPDINRCYKDCRDGKIVRVLPEGVLKDGCYIHSGMVSLTIASDRLNWPWIRREDGVILIVLDGTYYIVPGDKIVPDFKPYPSYPGRLVYDGLLRFRKYHPSYAFHHSDDVFDHWSMTEGDEHRQFYKAKLKLRLMIKRIRQRGDDDD